MALLEFDDAFEVVIVEDGSTVRCRDIMDSFGHLLTISYHYKSNTGPGDSRNFGMKQASGDYFIILDSDVILPPGYLKEVDVFLASRYADCYGGPDAAHDSFSNLQKAINYSMTSLLTTGGIRGGKKAVNKFQPRSFNMGISKKAFEASGGFGLIHPGEDPDLSLRLHKLGFSTVLIPRAVVYHKRRIDWGKFYTQVLKFGMVRPILNRWHPSSAKITYWFPSLFISGLLFSIIVALGGIYFFIYCYLLYLGFIWIDATIKNKSFNIGSAAIIATIIQFWGYGFGFLRSFWKVCILKMDPQTAFPKLFFNNAKKH